MRYDAVPGRDGNRRHGEPVRAVHMTHLLSPGSARLPVLGHQGSVGRLHRQAVADLDCRWQSMAADQKPLRFWKTANPACAAWPLAMARLKRATMTETLYHPTTPELAARRKARCRR